MNDANILIVGMGTTGKNVLDELKPLDPDFYDVKNPDEGNRLTHDIYDAIFICVDTPYIDAGNPCDLTAVKAVLTAWKHHLAGHGTFILKSTVLPGSTARLAKLFGTSVVYSSEYYGGTQHCNNFDFGFTILGGHGASPYMVQQLLQKCHDARHTFRIVEPTVAELAKYMENCYLAMKVSFCNQFFDIALDHGVMYEDLRELFILDPRVNPSHTFVYTDAPYWDTHCLNKDVRALAERTGAELLKSIIAFNDKRKK